MIVRRSSALAALVCGLGACHASKTIHETATVTANGALDASGKSVRGIRVTYDACPDLSSDVYFAKTSPGGRDLPPATTTCLQALAVGTKVDVTVRTNRNLQTAGGIPAAIGSCTLPDDFDSSTQVAGARVCSWAK